MTDAWMIRPLQDSDRPAVLQLNAGGYPAVQTLDAAALDWLLAFAGRHLVATDASGAVVAYLLAVPSASAYDDTEIRELRLRVAEPFLYICQVVVAAELRGAGIGRALYAAVDEVARCEGVRVVCCDVNLDPPNPESLAFHQRLGFTDLGRGTASNGFAITFLARWV